MVTRAASASSALVAPLRALGADVVELPSIEIAPPSDGGVALEAAIGQLDIYDWVVFTSPNGVDAFRSGGGDPAAAKIAAVGPKTAARCADAGWPVELVPERFVAEGLIEVFPPAPTGGRVLLARAEVARPLLPEALARSGWEVDDVPVYRSVTPAIEPALAARARAASVVTFASASTVERYLALVGTAEPAAAICIGPITGDAAREAGFDATDAEVHTIEGMLDELVRRFDP